MKEVNEGRGTDVRGVRVRGNRLVIDLVRASPRFLSTIAMPFFQATSTRLPLDREVVTVRSMADLPSAGPYVFTLNEVNRKTSLRRNPFWRRGPGRTAPRNLSGVDVLWNLPEQTAFEMVERGELDQGPVPVAEEPGVASRYGVNKTQFWVKAGPCVGEIAFNNYNEPVQGQRRAAQGGQLGSRQDRLQRDVIPPDAVDAPAAARLSRLGHEAEPSALFAEGEYREGETARRRPLRARKDHGRLRLVRDDRPGPGRAREA